MITVARSAWLTGVKVDRPGFVNGEPREADTTIARSAELRTPQAVEEVEVLTLDVELC